MKVIQILLLCLVLGITAGCATFTGPDNEIRISEFEGTGEASAGWASWFGAAGDAVVGGVRIIQEGAVEACVRFVGTWSDVWAGVCAPDTVPAEPARAPPDG